MSLKEHQPQADPQPMACYKKCVVGLVALALCLGAAPASALGATPSTGIGLVDELLGSLPLSEPPAIPPPSPRTDAGEASSVSPPRPFSSPRPPVPTARAACGDGPADAA